MRINELIQHTRALGADAAREGDIETGWFADKQIAQLENKKSATEAKLAAHP